ncbi:two component transcriptional regulator, AraC family [Paenibacillus algicola]|uniref:Two component transcriptional regulator, AraC family n=1 Tax=Paenibacillus algicola TaxID=2565926 RepID=A0A4V1G3K7_9BACL|nr:response regulator [Paenibacillus algicola]QCT01534.1 two component transcriptional regulator, AraC family [Paenibacillus algicola]
MYSVMVVEDEPWIRSAIVKMVEQAGHEFQVVGEAETGEKAWNMIQEHWPILLITDIQMPDMDGLSLIQKIHEHHIPMAIVIISGFDNFQYAQQAIRYGVAEYLLKPVESEKLIDVIHRCTEQLSSHKEMNQYFVKIQQFIEMMYVWDPRLHFNKLHDLVNSILRLKFINAGIRKNLLTILDGKIKEACMDMQINTSHLQLPDLSKDHGILDYFQTLLVVWATEFPNKKSQNSKLIINDICDRLKTSYHYDWTLHEMAEHSHLSPSHFGVLFKRQTGMSPVNYVNHIRIEQAKKLLKDTDKKIYEIAEAVGFANLPYFTRLFKQTVGYSPKEFRKRLGI